MSHGQAIANGSELGSEAFRGGIVPAVNKFPQSESL